VSSLENLRKQAKRILRWHRSGHVPVAAALRAGLPKLRALDDRAILAYPLRLADAQELVARDNGFSSWRALVEGCPAMNPGSKPLSDRPTLIGAEPQLLVQDVTAACTYYVERLGFSVAFTWGDPPFYAQVVRDAARLNLRGAAPLPGEAERRAAEQLLSAVVTLASADDLKRLFLEFQASDVAFALTLTTQPWGARNFIVRDPDGNLVLFASSGAGT